MTFPQNLPASEKTCPHLGLLHDPLSLMDFPSAENGCYHVTPPSAPSEDHQKKYCLEPGHNSCPLYQKASLKAMPKEISDSLKKPWFHFNIFTWITCGILFFMIGSFYYYWPWIEPGLMVPTLVPTGEQPGLAAIIPITGSRQNEEPTLMSLSTQTDTPTLKVTLTDTPTLGSTATEVNTQTLTLSPTGTPEPPHSLQTPIGGATKFLIHRVLGGETLEWIAENHGTTVDAIRAANYELPATLWEDSTIIVPVSQTDTAGILPMTAVKITGDSVSIENLAEDNQSNLLILCQLNNRTHSYVFAPGEWVLVPHQATPTPDQAG
jgi:LysM repeat protein